MSLFANFSEFFLHTTRVVPGGLVFSAEASVRTFGTLPPAAGFTDVSGFGSGQNAVRSTCANAAVASASEATTVATSPAIQLRPATKPPLVTPSGECKSRGVLPAPLPVAPNRVRWSHGVRGRRRLGRRAARGSL